MIYHTLEYTFYLSESIVVICRSRKKCALLDTENKKNATYSQILGSSADKSISSTIIQHLKYSSFTRLISKKETEGAVSS